MKKINVKILLFTCIVCLLPMFLGLAYQKQLPQSVVIHFDSNHQPDKYLTKIQFIYGIPLIMMLVQFFVSSISDIIKKQDKDETSILKWYVPIFTIVLYLITLNYILGKNLNARKIIVVLFGTIFVIIGIYLPKLRKIPNKKLNKKEQKKSKEEDKKFRRYGNILIIEGILCMSSILLNWITSVVIIGIITIEFIGIKVYKKIKK